MQTITTVPVKRTKKRSRKVKVTVTPVVTPFFAENATLASIQRLLASGVR